MTRCRIMRIDRTARRLLPRDLIGSVRVVGCGVVEVLANLLREVRQVVFHGVPQHVEVDLGVAVDRVRSRMPTMARQGTSATASVVSDDSALAASPISVTMFLAARTTSGSASKAARPR